MKRRRLLAACGLRIKDALIIDAGKMTIDGFIHNIYNPNTVWNRCNKISFLLMHINFIITLLIQTVCAVEMDFTQYVVNETTVIHLSDRDITSIKDVEKLYLNNNKPTKLPSEIGKLEMLDLKGNKIAENGEGEIMGKKELREIFEHRVYV